MKLIVPLPPATRAALPKVADAHPGLLLDKYAVAWDESGTAKGVAERVRRPALEQVVRLSAAPPPGLPFDDLLRRWELLAQRPGTISFRGITTGPLTFRPERPSAVEHPGTRLHPLYGFTYLPGPELRALAWAYAQELWLPAQTNRVEATAIVSRAFGPEPARTAGDVAFHDGWPQAWPRLVLDVAACHHRHYYDAGDPPGDWEEPTATYFLSVPVGTPFRFAVAPRRPEVAKKDVELAADWLAGGLSALGLGARTAAGYGHFTTDRITAPPVRRETFLATLELVTPAFLAGALQDGSDCDLRPAALRGQLRWWWRTLHAGFVDPAKLRDLEALVWGAPGSDDGVRLTVVPVGEVRTTPFDREAIVRSNHLPEPPDKKTAQGLAYHTFGMDDKPAPRRTAALPGTKWTVTLTARPGKEAKPLLEQAKAALTLLCHFGGVGAKGRKGFGSFADLPGFDLAVLKQQAAEFRQAFGAAGPFREDWALSPSLEQLLPPLEISTGGTNPWLALDQLAAAVQHFAKGAKHHAEKKALGLPRKIGSPVRGQFKPGPHVKKERHAAPMLYHFARDKDGKLLARVAAFPAAELPNLAESRKLLTELLAELQKELPGRFQQFVAGSRAAATPRAAGLAASVLPATGAKVPAVLLEERTKKGGWRAKHPASGLCGPIQNSDKVPADKRAGDEVTLVVATVTVGKEMAFKWPV